MSQSDAAMIVQTFTGRRGEIVGSSNDADRPRVHVRLVCQFDGGKPISVVVRYHPSDVIVLHTAPLGR